MLFDSSTKDSHPADINLRLYIHRGGRGRHGRDLRDRPGCCDVALHRHTSCAADERLGAWPCRRNRMCLGLIKFWSIENMAGKG